MGTTYKATFEVSGWEEQPFDERAGASKLTRATVTKTYDGDVVGESATEWLMAYASDESAVFVGIERITGSVGGQEGTLVLRHVGAFEDGVARAELTVVDDAGSGDLTSVSGTGSFVADHAGKVELDLSSS